MRLVCTRNEPDWVLYVAMVDSTNGFERIFSFEQISSLPRSQLLSRYYLIELLSHRVLLL